MCFISNSHLASVKLAVTATSVFSIILLFLLVQFPFDPEKIALRLSVQLMLLTLLFVSKSTVLYFQQHPPPFCFTGVLVIFTLLFCPVTVAAGGPILFFISAAIVINACSTLVAFLALVSKKVTQSWSANSCKIKK